jgi:hypothetical protein
MTRAAAARPRGELALSPRPRDVGNERSFLSWDMFSWEPKDAGG